MCFFIKKKIKIRHQPRRWLTYSVCCTLYIFFYYRKYKKNYTSNSLDRYNLRLTDFSLCRYYECVILNRYESVYRYLVYQFWYCRRIRYFRYYRFSYNNTFNYPTIPTLSVFQYFDIFDIFGISFKKNR